VVEGDDPAGKRVTGNLEKIQQVSLPFMRKMKSEDIGQTTSKFLTKRIVVRKTGGLFAND